MSGGGYGGFDSHMGLEKEPCNCSLSSYSTLEIKAELKKRIKEEVQEQKRRKLLKPLEKKLTHPIKEPILEMETSK